MTSRCARSRFKKGSIDMAVTKRVVIIGWDCAPPTELLDKWADQLPNLTRLANQGVAGPLRSTDPPITVPAWTSMVSSKNPGQLGFFGFRNRRVGEYDGQWIATSSAVRIPCLWDILSAEGKRCAVFNVPQTYPVKPLNGVMISSFLTPGIDSEYTYPATLKADIERVADGYKIDCENFRTDDKAALLEQIYEITDKRFAVAKYLMEQEAWDFFMMVYMGPDRIQHGFWKFHDPQHRKFQPGNPFATALVDYYKHLDDQLGELADLAGEDAAIMVVSDHGAKRMEGSFNINDWLIQEGLLTLKQPVKEPQQFSADLINWRRTVAWAWGGYYSRVFMNVRGREPQGRVLARNYERVRDDLIRRITQITDDQGRVMNTRALRPQEIFTGPHVDEAPDLLVYLDDLYWRAGQNIGNDSLYSFDTEIGPDDAVHDYDGVFVLSVPGGQRGERLGGLHLMDVAPTVLNLLGIPIPADFEGRSII